MKKVVIFGALLTLAIGFLTYVAFAGRGGDAFVGGFGGSMMGSVVGSAMTQPRGSSCGSDDGRALREVRHLEDIMRRDFGALLEKVSALERRVSDLENER
jgi:hypothetical protein